MLYLNFIVRLRLYFEMASESVRLLVNSHRPSQYQQNRTKYRVSSCSKILCLPSKAATLILLWTAVVGAMYHVVTLLAGAGLFDNRISRAILPLYDPLPYAALAVVMMFYPLSGFIADVYCGRLKTITVSLLVFLLFDIFVIIGESLFQTVKHPVMENLDSAQGIAALTILTVSLLAFVVGLAGYQANFIQLGLDQLFEAPSHYLSLFIHYATWAFRSGTLLFVLIPTFVCWHSSPTTVVIALSTTYIISLVSSLLMYYWKKKWFYTDHSWNNPYKTVYRVLKFAKEHRYPLQRSAFTYSDNYIPSRLDFAKERFGGPFTTEQVEDVKTLLRILYVLLAIGPVFTMEVTASVFIYPIITLFHFHDYYKETDHTTKYYCTREGMIEIIFTSAIMKEILSILLLFPVYTWFLFCILRKRVPRLFLRLGMGIVICLMGIASLLITDLVGHSMDKGNFINQTTQCMFQITVIPHNGTHIYPSLNMHWAVIFPPNILLGVGPMLIVATTLEFISAQSPQSMKGLLVGVFFAIRGLFQFLNSITIVPLSLRKKPWASASGEMLQHPPVTNCGFVYLLLTCVSGLIGLILFSVAAKRYKYRTRDEGMFSQQEVEDIYDRYLPPAVENDGSDCSSSE